MTPKDLLKAMKALDGMAERLNPGLGVVALALAITVAGVLFVQASSAAAPSTLDDPGIVLGP